LLNVNVQDTSEWREIDDCGQAHCLTATLAARAGANGETSDA
jgi:hypothetical protein